jgi:predicted MPP superfamily phosphohydrolase
VWFRGLPEGGARVERIQLAFPRLTEGLDGLRILFASDVHAGFTFPEEAQKRLIAQIAALAPDMVLWGGDFAESREDAQRLFEKIGGLKPRFGMAGVAGNNDRRAFRGTMGEFSGLAERAGVHMLINGRWAPPCSGMTVCGLDEDYYGAPNASILDGLERKNALTVLLSHSPAPLEALLSGKVPPDLTLAGHTHGGQARLFGLSPYDLGFDHVRRGQRFFTARGVKREGDGFLVVSGGLGSSRVPLRLNCPPEIQLITLARR